MKKSVLAFVALLVGTHAFANNTVTCKKSDEASGQGYEVTISGRTASLQYKGVDVATLVLTGSKPSAGGDMPSIAYYSQNAVNGFQVQLISGGLAGMTSAKVLHGGFAGFTEQATLNDCK